MKKHIVSWTLVAAMGLGLAACGSQEQDKLVPALALEKNTETSDGGIPVTPKPLPDNYADPAKPTMVPYYDLPAAWEVSPSSKNMLRSTDERQEPAYLWLDLYDANSDGLTLSADKRLSELTCTDGHSLFGIWQNCDRPAQKDNLIAGSSEIIHLRYWGTWRDADMQVDEFMFVDHELVYIVTLEGGRETDLEAVMQIITTLDFRYEVFTPGVENEELGGL